MYPGLRQQAPPRRTRAERVVLSVLWLAALVTIAAIRLFSPPYHGIDRRIDTYEWVDVLRWLAEIPLVASAVVTTVVWAAWRRGWWPYQLTLLAMGASVIYSAAMAPWSEGYGPVECSGGDDPVATRWAFQWDPRVIWSLAEWQWNTSAPFVAFLPYLLVLIGAASAPLVVRLVRRWPPRREHARVVAGARDTAGNSVTGPTRGAGNPQQRASWYLNTRAPIQPRTRAPNASAAACARRGVAEVHNPVQRVHRPAGRQCRGECQAPGGPHEPATPHFHLLVLRP